MNKCQEGKAKNSWNFVYILLKQISFQLGELFLIIKFYRISKYSHSGFTVEHNRFRIIVKHLFKTKQSSIWRFIYGFRGFRKKITKFDGFFFYFIFIRNQNWRNSKFVFVYDAKFNLLRFCATNSKQICATLFFWHFDWNQIGVSIMCSFCLTCLF